TGAHHVTAGARVVHCPHWQLGPGASLRCGLAALAPDVEAAVVVLADGPWLAPEAVERVLAAWRGSRSRRPRNGPRAARSSDSVPPSCCWRRSRSPWWESSAATRSAVRRRRRGSRCRLRGS